MAQQTAVEFIETELVKLNIPTDSGTQVSVIRIFEQAKQMEKMQIVKAHDDGDFWSGEKYYNETYGK